MNAPMILIPALVLTLSASLVSATVSSPVPMGGISDGGGKAVVCRDSNGQITSAEVLDLYEGRAMYGLEIPLSNAPMKEQVEAAVNVMTGASRPMVNIFVNELLPAMRFTPPGSKLTPIDDSFEVVLPGGCQAEQLANFYNQKLLLVSGDIWAHLSETNRAALILHEAVYRYLRTAGAKDSRRTRNIVAHLFSPGRRWIDVEDQIPRNALACGGKGVLARAYKNSENAWVLQFLELGGPVMSKKTLVVPSGTAQEFDFEEARGRTILRGEDLIGRESAISGGVESNFENLDVWTLTKSWRHLVDSNGKIVPGYQTPRYVLSMVMQNYPDKRVIVTPLGCSDQIHTIPRDL